MFYGGPFVKAMQRQVSRPPSSFLPSGQYDYTRQQIVSLCLSSQALPAGGVLPFEFTHRATNSNPPICISGLPSATRSLSIVLEHRNTPIAPRTHWLCYDLPPLQAIRSRELRGTPGRNDFLVNGYTGPLGLPCSGSFCFIVYALRQPLHLPVGASRYKVQRLLATELIAVGEFPFYA